MKDRSKLITEQRNLNTLDIDDKSTLEIVDIINTEDSNVIKAVHNERQNISKSVDLIVESFKKGGRLFYIGAGTSGRLGVLDASECPPTFGTDPGIVIGIIAGGLDALTKSIEGAEDRHVDGEQAIIENGITEQDTIVGIATSGTTPFVHGALIQANRIGATTIFLCCNPDINPTADVDVIIRPITGEEVITGSTRLKAGTATKLILNTLTTTSMIKMGKVYENLMVDLQVKNVKLKDRAERIIMTVTDLGRDAADKLLDKANGNVKSAIVMHKLQTSYKEARKRLDECDGFVRKVLNNDNL
ncbi:MAG: N-acetylmuramic acid 6-phosphate etherase [Candidatus Scalindua sp.]|jgi:N-acetylmuramic acid 6-phosphate etherase|nr:N-acetylmuramic acid 6-phosphate etherase [Candidatus Scalindua sp.]MBT5304325.1 N-acetylmuramic acid 6-phosphate etherase [Candidatus Scalindua sp.]MBT6052300.1 N-acetylmuramic acid 6-phosphate etherase [Candidatus Scalindua sp.]MBT6226043.1 N-acetylmuramic acid 6-phosphate etherase [Candidatus Scalindua sp.]MBT6563931.1 N-acetylmuramic acid 6-phosphate etherase [Candidatus Scalindua sp.]